MDRQVCIINEEFNFMMSLNQRGMIEKGKKRKALKGLSSTQWIVPRDDENKFLFELVV